MMPNACQTQMIDWFTNRTAVLATMHQKEQAIAPILQPALGIEIIVPDHFDTDVFGTFTREIERPGDQLTTARLKAIRSMEPTGATIAIASEGSFAPHPAFPMLPCDRELVVFIDTTHDLEIIGEAISTQTNFSHCSIQSVDEANEFALKVGFPEHGLIVMVNRTSIDNTQIIKGITSHAQLKEAVEFALSRSNTGKIHIETDMRAMHNPTRMKVIAEATQDLVQKINHRCPRCSTPGFALIENQSGLPCALCGLPTNSTLVHLYECRKCGFRQEKLYPNGMETCDPTYCQYCNP